MPVPLASGAGRVSTVARLAEIPEEQIWLAKQKSARTRRAYRLDVQHFMATLGIETTAELRQADHRAVIAWERHMREIERAAPSPSAGGSRPCPRFTSIWCAKATPPATR
ncbi:MAG: hypothetical protein JOZ32_17875 [Bryobacterales bacterium]|nr:hypothetical protein [Bryobacterales bacterium]